MRIKRFAIFLGILIVVILLLAWRLGAFKRVDLAEGKQPNLLMAGRWFHAPYREILDYVDIQFLPLVNSIPEITGICAVYFDNPQLVISDSLKAFAGLIVADSAAAPPGLILRQIFADDALLASFNGSPIIGQYKVYPAVERWFQASRDSTNGTILEVYHRDRKTRRVDYYFPVAHDEN